MLKVKDLIGKNKKASTIGKYKIKFVEYNKQRRYLSGNVVRKIQSDKDVGRSYLVQLKWFSTFNKNAPIQLSCSCTDFSARWRYVLYKHDSYYIGKNMFTLNDKSLLEPPDVRNPKHEVGVCKHLEFVLNSLLASNVRV